MREETELTPVQQLDSLLARALNPFDVGDETLRRLERSVLHEVASDHGRRHSLPPGVPQEPWWGSFRHVFLLADGSSELLWELCYASGGADGQLQSEVYEREPELRRAEGHVTRRLDSDLDGSPDGGPANYPYGDADMTADESFISAPELPTWLPRQRGYTEGDSPEHARRLLRRAENPDRPGDDVRGLLSTAQAHEIVHVPRPHALVQEWHVWCSVYEHAFLLADGTELSLYELEHDLSGSGQLVCEVYLEESAADRAAHRHARDRGFGD